MPHQHRFEQPREDGMQATEWRTFIHPQKAYRLEFPAHWEHRVEDEGRSCGFGPWERDNVGLWISIMPASLDTERLGDDLEKLFEQALARTKGKNLREDPTIRHHALKADIAAKGEGGNYWIIAGGDLVLFASSQVPAAERDVWTPAFERVMSSLRITRDKELQMRKFEIEVLERLRERHPDQDYKLSEKGIRGRNHVVYLSNVYREVKADPERREEIIERFVDAIKPSAGAMMGQEQWDDVQDQILPVLKPIEYIQPEGPTKSILTTEWLPDVVICYVIRGDRTFRFLTGWDLDRWGIDSERLHEKALENLAGLEWPRRLDGARQPGGGRLILVCPTDGFAASRLLHPELHRIFSGPLGSPFMAGIPDRDTLVVFTDRHSLKKRLVRQIRKDYKSSGYPITPRTFLVTPDGIAPAGGKE